MVSKVSKLSLVSFIMFVISGGGTILAELFWGSIHDIEYSMCLAYCVVLLFYPCIFISFILALISVVRIVLYKQKGIIFSFLTLILSASLIIWAWIVDSRPEDLKNYAPVKTEEVNESKNRNL